MVTEQQAPAPPVTEEPATTIEKESEKDEVTDEQIEEQTKEILCDYAHELDGIREDVLSGNLVVAGDKIVELSEDACQVCRDMLTEVMDSVLIISSVCPDGSSCEKFKQEFGEQIEKIKKDLCPEIEDEAAS